MADISTPHPTSKKSESTRQHPGPKQTTINFLKQFARCYTYEPRLRPADPVMMIN